MAKEKINQKLLFEAETLMNGIQSLRQHQKRVIVAIAGPPASGKSTLAKILVDRLNESFESEHVAALLPMDGFHLDNRILQQRDLLQRKGSPNTFDVDGFRHLIGRLREGDEDVVHPVFDRSIDMAIASAGVIRKNVPIVVIEGNYLLLNDEKWKLIQAYYDYSIFIRTSIDILKQRLINRWIDHGFSLAEARQKASKNDLLNAEFILRKSVRANHCIDQ